LYLFLPGQDFNYASPLYTVSLGGGKPSLSRTSQQRQLQVLLSLAGFHVLGLIKPSPTNNDAI
jgi:hypothetical protein